MEAHLKFHGGRGDTGKRTEAWPCPARMCSSPRPPSMIPQWWPLLVSALWLGVVGLGFHLSVAYQAGPGEPALPEGAWPLGAPFPPDAVLPTLVLAAHPHCPCTRATLRELDRLVTRSGGRMRVYVLFYSDPALGPDWVRSDSWKHAQSIPGVEVAADPQGSASALFGARTSGQVFLFGSDGRLLFEGGITAARGHEGSNLGASAVADLVSGRPSRIDHTPVFGCALAASSARKP